MLGKITGGALTVLAVAAVATSLLTGPAATANQGHYLAAGAPVWKSEGDSPAINWVEPQGHSL
ncbi:hypothetical protein ABT095_36155 [Kitasatospora sp. NPDC002227]|uniref:hypothetical protein n=1 Tax=Kitasatospora sp. NPDC002227 TaxID=3154773 RepID=UPI00331F091D